MTETWRGAWRRPWIFDYTDDQWRKIETKVKGGGVNTPKEPFNYRALLEAANCFLDDSFRSKEEQDAAFDRVIRLQLELRVAVAVAFEDLGASKNLFDQLDELERLARYRRSLLTLNWSPKQEFYRTVLECWGEAGGLFSRSRESPKNDGGARLPTGPLIEYFEAAVGPVMGEEAPGREAIYKIIARHKKFDEELEALIEATSKGEQQNTAATALRALSSSAPAARDAKDVVAERVKRFGDGDKSGLW